MNNVKEPIIKRVIVDYKELTEKEIVESMNAIRKPFSEEEVGRANNFDNIDPAIVRIRIEEVFNIFNIGEEYHSQRVENGQFFIECNLTICGKVFKGIGSVLIQTNKNTGQTIFDKNTVKSASSTAFKDAAKRLGVPLTSGHLKYYKSQQPPYRGSDIRNNSYNNTNYNDQQPIYNQPEPNFEQMNNQDPFINPNFEQMNGQQNIVQMPNQNSQNNPVPCSDCGYAITSQNVIQKSTKIHGKALCWNCQQKKKAN
ncbi:hypothetical protein ACIQVU_07865 [Lysinibacillus sp. NPDC098008]|uniref:hypothetical protein n=1 Tax=Lysinibacillus sp. NPDC098008 TaxID=3364146 RepID=UPI00382686A8